MLMMPQYRLKGGRQRLIVIVLLLVLLGVYLISTVNHFSLKDAELKVTKLVSILSSNDIDLINVTQSADNYKLLGRKLRIFDRLFKNQRPLNPQELGILADLKNEIFPWLAISLEDLQVAKGDGIVICGYDGGFQATWTLIQKIRQVHNSSIPIQVYYVGDGDLSPENQTRLAQIIGVITIDVTKLFNNSLLRLERWAIKPFALLASTFENAILMDVDVVLFKSPELLFTQKGFISTGALFFKDRSMNDEVKDWAKAREIATDLAGGLTPTLKNLRFFNGKTNYQQESGVVVVNRKKSLTALMAVCVLNAPPRRDQLYQVVYGDKETFWMGFETLNTPFQFGSLSAGVIGTPVQDKRICCKQILHVDDFAEPFWMNGAKDGNFPPLDSWTIESEAGDHWEWAEDGVCLTSKSPHKLSDKQKDLISALRKPIL